MQAEHSSLLLRQVGPYANVGGNGTPPATSSPGYSPSFDGDDRDPAPNVANPEEPPSDTNNPSIGPQPDDTTLTPSELEIPDTDVPQTANPDLPPSDDNNPSNGPQPDYSTLPLSSRPIPGDGDKDDGGGDDLKPNNEGVGAGATDAGTLATLGTLIANYLRPITPNFLKPIVSAFTTAGGIATGAVVSGVALLLYPRPMGGRPDTIVSQSIGAEIIASTGELIIDGETSGIHVIPVSYDDYGNPTGFGPASLGDAEELGNLLGAPVFVGEPLGQLVDNGSVVNNDGVPGDGVEESAEAAINHDAEYPPDPSQIEHIFGDRPGHIPDTEENRELVQDAVNEENFQGTNQFGNEVYHEVNNDGSQTWVHVRDGVIQNAGVNAPGNHY